MKVLNVFCSFSLCEATSPWRIPESQGSFKMAIDIICGLVTNSSGLLMPLGALLNHRTYSGSAGLNPDAHRCHTAGHCKDSLEKYANAQGGGRGSIKSWKRFFHSKMDQPSKARKFTKIQQMWSHEPTAKPNTALKPHSMFTYSLRIKWWEIPVALKP